MLLVFEIIFRNNKTGKKYMIVNQIREIKFPRNILMTIKYPKRLNRVKLVLLVPAVEIKLE